MIEKMSQKNPTLQEMQAESRKRHRFPTGLVYKSKSKPVPDLMAPVEPPAEVPVPEPVIPKITYLEKLEFEERVARIRAIANKVESTL